MGGKEHVFHGTRIVLPAEAALLFIGRNDQNLGLVHIISLTVQCLFNGRCQHLDFLPASHNCKLPCLESHPAGRMKGGLYNQLHLILRNGLV